MKETTAIESPRRAVELRRAELDGGGESHVDGADGISDTVHPWGPREPSDQTPPGSDQSGVAVSGTVVQVSTAVGASAARRRGVAGAGARRRSRTSESRERDGQAAGFGGCPRERPHSPRRRLRRRPLGAAVRSTPNELCSPSGDLFF